MSALARAHCMWVRSVVVVLLLLLDGALRAHCLFGQLYRYQLLYTSDSHRLCPDGNGTCSDGSPHILCHPVHLAPQCAGSGFELIAVTAPSIRTFVNAHNGIRSKVASDFHIANMNLVYWSPELAEMARAHVYQCRMGDNRCNTIGSSALVVGQNYLFRANRRVLLHRWPGHAVRHWYTELGLGITTWPAVVARYERGDGLINFMQLTWPPVEFIGCAAARMFHGIYIVCYYQPAVNASEVAESARGGCPCAHCPPDRPTCSQLFVSLCGIDVPLVSACPRLAAQRVTLAALWACWGASWALALCLLPQMTVKQ